MQKLRIATGPISSHAPASEYEQHGDVLILQLAHEHDGGRARACVEAAVDDAVEREEREEGGAHLDDEAADRHDHVQPLHEVDPLVARPVHGRIWRHDAVERQAAAADGEDEERQEEPLSLRRAVVLEQTTLDVPQHARQALRHCAGLLFRSGVREAR